MNQSILEVRHLRTLVALRDSGSLVRAAQLLNLTQSALSHQIKLLEDRYGQPLFERKSVPPQFTAVGERLREDQDERGDHQHAQEPHRHRDEQPPHPGGVADVPRGRERRRAAGGGERGGHLSSLRRPRGAGPTPAAG